MEDTVDLRKLQDQAYFSALKRDKEIASLHSFHDALKPSALRRIISPLAVQTSPASTLTHIRLKHASGTLNGWVNPDSPLQALLDWIVRFSHDDDNLEHYEITTIYPSKTIISFQSFDFHSSLTTRHETATSIALLPIKWYVPSRTTLTLRPTT